MNCKIVCVSTVSYRSYLQSLYVQTEGVILIVTNTEDVMVVMVIHCT